MPSNQELLDQIAELSEKLDKKVETEGLNNNELNKLAKELRAELKEFDNGADEAAAKKAEVQAQKEEDAKNAPELSGLRVAPGRSVTSKKGIMDENQPVSANIFEGGEETVKKLLKAGILVK